MAWQQNIENVHMDKSIKEKITKGS